MIIWSVCVYTQYTYTEYSSMACVPGSHGQVDTETELHAESQDEKTQNCRQTGENEI